MLATENQELLSQLNAKKSIEVLRDKFHLHVNKSKNPRALGDISIFIENDTICIFFDSIKISASPRTVFSKGKFFVEYLFFYTEGTEKIEAWRFYLSDDGKLKSTPDDSGECICDFDLEEIKHAMFFGAGRSFMRSKVLIPSAVD